MANITVELKETLKAKPEIKEVYFTNQTDYFFNAYEVDGVMTCNGKEVKETLKSEDILKVKETLK